MIMRILSLLLVSLLATASRPEEKPVHLFILSGQSNMCRMDPEKGFLPELATLVPDATVLHVKSAFSGKPIRNWLAEWDDLAREAGLDPAAIREKDKVKGSPFFAKMVNAARPHLKNKPTTVTLCWMQGESDARDGAEKVYGAALARLIENLRTELKREDLNVVIGRISDFGSENPKGDTWPGWEAIREAQTKTAREDDRGAWVDTDDCNGKENGLHCPEEGYALMGRRMARQAVFLIRGEEPNDDGRP